MSTGPRPSVPPKRKPPPSKEDDEEKKIKKIHVDCQKIAGVFHSAHSTLFETKNLFKHYSGAMEVLGTLLERQLQKLMDKRLMLVSSEPKNFELNRGGLLCKNGLLSSTIEQEEQIKQIVLKLNEARGLCAMESYMLTGPWPHVPPIRPASSAAGPKTN